MNSKYLIPVIASALILTMVLSSLVPVMAQAVPTIGPKLDVKTIPQDDQVLKKGIIVLGLVPNMDPTTPPYWPSDKGYAPGNDIISQHKLLVSFNGLLLFWKIGEDGPIITCNVLEKDKVNPIPDKFGITTKQFPQENLVTKLIDVSDKFICKPRWKTPSDMPGWYESAGVLDVYYNGPTVPGVIADNILIVTATLVLGRVIVQGTDMQDICLLGWSMSPNWTTLTLPDHGATVILWSNAMGPFVGCEEAALEQRNALGVVPEGVVQSTA
jgi:hypothetical protein